MSFLQPDELGLYAPASARKAQIAKEGEYAIKQAIFTYKQLFYGLRLVAWKNRDKAATFYEALSKGELDQFKVAPGYRDDTQAGDGRYTKSEWDYDRLNAYMWNRFRERFDAAFNLEAIQTLKTYKDLNTATTELLEFALANWGDYLLGERAEVENSPMALAPGMKLKLEIDGIYITGSCQKDARRFYITAKNFDLPVVEFSQFLLDGRWKTSIGTQHPGGRLALTAEKAAVQGEMMLLASRLARDTESFMANPEGFLGIESAQAHTNNLNLVKARLLEINQNHYERKKAERDDAQLELAEAETPFPQPSTPVTTPSSRPSKQLEAQQWLDANQHLLEPDIDAELGVTIA
ncbi:MAG: hypothetical protein KME17_23760 [Cyanosarcina radialis HA8281-LM2]|jgi:hypothetical protein|nr:hypothetical protein [Cyanosarcina radialis HA8281-LM2]